MNTFKAVCIYLCAFAALVFSQGNPQWYSLGLEERRVICLLTDDTTKILAGTDQGLHVYFQGKWYPVEGLPVNVPIQAIVRISDTKVMAAMGGGSNSDGIYMGEAIIKGPPFYSFSLVEYLEYPQQLAAGSRNRDTVYAGTVNALYMMEADGNGGYQGMRELTMPPYSFGVEDPYCAALHVYSMDNNLWAGGYDMSPLPGPGHLLVQAGDSMVTEKNWNVTSIAEVIWGAGPMEYHDLHVATRDSGVYKLDPLSSSAPWTNLGSPLGEPVFHLISHANFVTQAGPFGILHAAAPSGVYSLPQGSKWTEIGDIPAAPLFLSSRGGYPMVLHAGTVNGVYRYGVKPAGTGAGRPSPEQNLASVELDASAFSRTGVLTVTTRLPGHLRLEVLDLIGKRVGTLADRHVSAGRHQCTWDMNSPSRAGSAAGVYFLRVSIAAGDLISRVFIE